MNQLNNNQTRFSHKKSNTISVITIPTTISDYQVFWKNNSPDQYEQQHHMIFHFLTLMKNELKNHELKSQHNETLDEFINWCNVYSVELKKSKRLSYINKRVYEIIRQVFNTFDVKKTAWLYELKNAGIYDVLLQLITSEALQVCLNKIIQEFECAQSYEKRAWCCYLMLYKTWQNEYPIGELFDVKTKRESFSFIFDFLESNKQKIQRDFWLNELQRYMTSNMNKNNIAVRPYFPTFHKSGFNAIVIYPHPENYALPDYDEEAIRVRATIMRKPCIDLAYNDFNYIFDTDFFEGRVTNFL